jgi:DNA (cytosine-5)-methyltransferase 1
MLKVTSLFSGIGAFEQALTNLGVEYELVNFCEIDKYATKVYCAIHNIDESLNLGDISKVGKLNYCDLLTYGFPCTDISVAGKQEGLTKGEGTRSGLLWEVERLLKDSEKPKYLIMENVKNLVGKKFKHEFYKWLIELENLGYNNYWQVLNAKHYGLAQNRERVFVVSIRKDVDTNGYVFPEKQELKLRLKDILEDSVDEKYYISNEKTKTLMVGVQESRLKDTSNISQVGLLDIKGNEQVMRVYSENGISPTLNTMQGGNREPKILKIVNETGNHYGGGVFDKEGICPTLTSSSGGGVTNNLPKICEQRTDEGLRFFKDNICGTIRTIDAGGDKRVIEIDKSIKPKVAENFEREKDNILKSKKNIYQAKCDSGWQDNKIGLKISQTIRANNSFHPCLDNNYRIRKLTPLECWRLMGFKDEAFYKAKNSGISNTQLYKQAGNSIVVNVLEAIFKQMGI